MRKPFPKQGRLDCPSVEDLKINVNCRDEIIPILVALRHIYSDTRLTDSILELVGADVNVVTDSTVVDTNIHYPTESSLIYDGLRKVIELCCLLYDEYDITGWRQHGHLLQEVKKCNRDICRIVAKKGGELQRSSRGQLP